MNSVDAEKNFTAGRCLLIAAMKTTKMYFYKIIFCDLTQQPAEHTELKTRCTKREEYVQGKLCPQQRHSVPPCYFT